jgi:hypothetical protein
MRKTAALPEDVEALKSLVLERSRALEVAEALCISQKLELEKLRFQIAVLKRERYGRSSEQLDQELNQMRLSIEDLETSLAERPPEVRPAPKEPAEKPTRRALPPHFPREEIVHESPCSCPDCGGTMRVLGEDVSEMIEYVPERFKVARSSPARSVRRSFKRQLPAGPLPEAWPALAFSPTSWCPSTWIICRYTDRVRCTSAMSWI